MRFSKHRYDVKNRPENNELTKHFKENHDMNKDLKLFIIHNNIRDTDKRIHLENLSICQMQSLQPNGLNVDKNQFTEETYTLWK